MGGEKPPPLPPHYLRQPFEVIINSSKRQDNVSVALPCCNKAMTSVDIASGAVKSASEGAVGEILTKITPDPTCSLKALIKVILIYYDVIKSHPNQNIYIRLQYLHYFL